MHNASSLALAVAFVAPIAFAQPVDPSADLKKLEGTWMLVAGEIGCPCLPHDPALGCHPRTHA